MDLMNWNPTSVLSATSRLKFVLITSDRKVYVFGLRIHHGLAGLFAIAAGSLALWHDWKDRPWYLRDR